MRKFKISYAKTYQKQDNTTGTSWKTLGYANEITSQDGKVTIHGEFDSIPPNWNGEFKLFLQEEQQQNNQQGGYNQPQQQSYQQPNQGMNSPVQYEQKPQQ
ncbi:MAG: hypothetical protein GQ570_11660 [Helicobacteraceae bacterium]|nr:hypothetical protein [Helicobacteraceae bacterium]